MADAPIDASGHRARLRQRLFDGGGGALLDHELVESVMQRLRAHGVRFALDDFGCGCSDLSTLRKLPICVLKIDRSLLIDAEIDPAARIILRNVVSLCGELGIRSICEGAETTAQVEFLRQIECDLVQGSATGRPARIEEVEKSLRPPRPDASALRTG